LVAAAFAALAMALPVGAQAKAKKHKPKVVGAVYSESNSVAKNRLYKYNRYDNGKLKLKQSVATGGRGSTQDFGCNPGCPILDSDSAVDITPGGKLIFAVNAGSDTVSSFRETKKGLKLVDTQSSGGDLPESLTVHGKLLYVLNVGTATISGIRVDSNGNMSAIANSTKPLAFPPGTAARGIGFDNTGKTLVVSEVIPPPGQLTTFKVNSDGTTGPAISNPSSGALPFGFAFDRKNRLFVSNIVDLAGTGSFSSYNVTGGNALTAIDTKLTNGALPCWVAVTPNGKYAYVVNTGAGKPATVSRFTIASNGSVTYKGQTAPRAKEFARTDITVSRDGKYVYVLSPGVAPPPAAGNTGHVDVYKVTSGGGLKFIQSTPRKGAVGQTGLAGR
jgi:6-phosphogluconolactonase (cycloisomerase 2 family)